MEKYKISPGLNFFGNLVDIDCNIKDLKLVLQKTEEIEFPDHETVNEEEGLITNIFPDITRKSFIVTLIILLDDQLKTFCEILKQATDQKIKWNELRGSPLERFITYSEKVCGLQNVYDESSRQLLSGLIEVRNCIVHNNSWIEGFNNKKVIQQFVKQISGLDIIEGYISFELSACNECADIVFKFMEHAYNSALEIFPDHTPRQLDHEIWKY